MENENFQKEIASLDLAVGTNGTDADAIHSAAVKILG